MDSKSYILITGATSGIGREIAVGLSKEYSLILSGRNVEKLEQTLSLCVNREKHLTWVCNLQNIDALEQSLAGFLTPEKISVSGFIHCAGFLKMLPLKRATLQNLHETMNVNFSSAALIIKTLLAKKLNEQNLKSVVFISSIASLGGVKGFNIYSASKGALDSLMRSLAVELAPQVKVNSVLPGSIKTQMTESIYSDPVLLEKMLKEHPLGLGETKDIFEMVAFLISEKSKWITGQQFVVDGGRSINISA